MDPLLLGRGFLFGFTAAASVGPIWLLCARRTLAEGRLVGLFSGLGVAMADAFYGAVAALGLSALTALFVEQRLWLRLVGGLVLCTLGLSTLRARPRERAVAPARRGLGGAFLSTLALTLTNPMTIVAFLGVFAGLGLADARGDARSGVSLVAGVFLGSASWWVIMAAALERVRGWLTPRALHTLNLLAGGLLAGFGLLAILAAFGG